MGGRKREEQMYRRKRILKVEKMLLRGVTNQNELAAMFGVSQPTIGEDIKWIERMWVRTDPLKVQTRRAKRVRQLEANMLLALDSFDRSRKDEEELSTTTKTERCGDCSGSGVRDQDWCFACDGVGQVKVDVSVRRIKGQAGDSSFLSTVNSCLTQIAKLEGLEKPKQVTRKQLIKKEVLHTHLFSGISGELADASEDAILDAKIALTRLRESIMAGADGRDRLTDEGVVDGSVLRRQEDEDESTA